MFDGLAPIDDPWFYATAVLAVLVLGIAKGGLAGGIGLVAVPLMSLTVEPARAAAILLPILMLMDVTALRPYWRRWDRRNLVTTAPGAVLGTAIGFATFELLSPDDLRVLVGFIALAFSLRWWLARAPRPARAASMGRGTLWSTLAGFTSFSVHAGGPPLHIYLLSQRLDKTTFQATTVAFFFGVNWLKLGPYAWLGQLDGSNLPDLPGPRAAGPDRHQPRSPAPPPYRRDGVLSRRLRIARRSGGQADPRRRDRPVAPRCLRLQPNEPPRLDSLPTGAGPARAGVSNGVHLL